MGEATLETTKVYLVFGGWDYEGSDVLAVMPTKEAAEEVAERARSGGCDDTKYDFVSVQEWGIGEVSF